MSEPITLRGLVLPDGSLRLAAPLSLPQGEVEVTIRSVAPAGGKESLRDFIAHVRAEQHASGHVPRSAEEVQGQLRQTDEEWDEHDREFEAIHRLGRQSRDTPPEAAS
jgi:hypothetical protein